MLNNFLNFRLFVSLHALLFWKNICFGWFFTQIFFHKHTLGRKSCPDYSTLPLCCIVSLKTFISDPFAHHNCTFQYFDDTSEQVVSCHCEKASFKVAFLFFLNLKIFGLRRVASLKTTDFHMGENESQKIKQGWSNIASLHCVLLPEFIKPSDLYASPRNDLLARRYN